MEWSPKYLELYQCGERIFMNRTLNIREIHSNDHEWSVNSFLEVSIPSLPELRPKRIHVSFGGSELSSWFKN